MGSCFTTGQLSRQGGRSYNEDHFDSSVTDEAACWVLADGLGGHGGGAEASAYACEAVLKSFERNPEVTPEAVRLHIAAAHQAVLDQQAAQPGLARMRTTVVVLVANTTHAAWGHVGDSRLYHLRGGRVIAQTKDHSVPQSLVDAGEIQTSDIRHHEDRSRLLRSLGEGTAVKSAIVPEAVPIFQGDAFVLCSDGFWENVYEVEMAMDFAKSDKPADWLRSMENRLQLRVDGSHDNYTAIAVMGEGLPVAAPAPPASSTVAQKDESTEEVVKTGEIVNMGEIVESGEGWPHRLMNLAVFVVIPVCLLVALLSVVLSNGKIGI